MGSERATPRHARHVGRTAVGAVVVLAIFVFIANGGMRRVQLVAVYDVWQQAEQVDAADCKRLEGGQHMYISRQLIGPCDDADASSSLEYQCYREFVAGNWPMPADAISCMPQI